LSTAGTNGAVELFLGSNKIVLENGAPVTVGQDATAVTGTHVTFAASSTKTTSITVSVTPSQASVYGLKAGDSYTDPVFKELKWQFAGVTPGLMDSSRDMVQLVPSGTNQLNFAFTNAFGTDYNVPLVQAVSGTAAELAWGTGTNQDYVLAANWDSTNSSGTGLGTADTFKLLQNNRFVLTNNQYSRIMQVQSIDTYNNRTTFSDVGSGETFKATSIGTVSTSSTTGYYNATGNSGLQVVQLTVDGQTYDFAMVPASTPYLISTSSSTGQPTNVLLTQHGAKLTLDPNSNLTTSSSGDTAAVLTLEEGGLYTQDKAGQGASNLTLNAKLNGYNPGSGKAFTVATPTLGSGTLGTGTEQSNTDLTDYVDPWGTFVQQNTNSNSAWQKVYFPDMAMRANVYLAPESATTSTSGGEGSVTTQTVQRINVGAALLDSEADSLVGTTNLIVVGGPCANTVAAALMGNPAQCNAGFEPGKGMIKVFDQSGHESILVAGYEAAETRLASQVLANYDQYRAQLQGQEVVVEGTSLSSVQISAPAASNSTA
jgi:hypothetical protein